MSTLLFEPTPAAAQARLAAVRPSAYADTRNHLEGAVTRLSPYISRGFLDLPEVLQAVQQRHPMPPGHKFIQELSWREYFHHVWEHRGNGILESLHPGPHPEKSYARALPDAFLQARTGVRAIDRGVQTLVHEGWLHNHARLWLAGWLVHEARVHWRVGADWMYGHLIDGDLASNHLSWQWVSGTGSHKPYLFTEGNAARFAPRDWHGRWKAPPASPDGVLPGLSATPPQGSGFLPAPPAAEAGLSGQPVWLAHPGGLADPPEGFKGRVVAVLPTDDLAQRPWGALRWRFVLTRLRALAGDAGPCWIGPGLALAAALRTAASVDGRDDPHLPPPLRRLGLRPVPRLHEPPAGRCDSFSRFWRQVGPG